MDWGRSSRAALQTASENPPSGRVLYGEKLENPPVIEVTGIDLVIITKTAKTLGLTVPLFCLAAPMR
jgi:hypothetical protein